MANSTTVQILEEGPRNAVIKVTGVLDTSDVAVTTLLAMATIDQTNTGKTPTAVRIDDIDYSISGQLTVGLDWHATTNVTAVTLAGSQRMLTERYGGIQNNAGSGKDGAIDIWTKGYASGTQTFTLIIKLVKIGTDL